MTPKPKPPASPIVCDCLRVTEADILDAIKHEEIRDVKDIISYTQAGDGCTACHPLLREYLERSKKAEARKED
jgi:NAD(P)H-nitrite reductase large subunit